MSKICEFNDLIGTLDKKDNSYSENIVICIKILKIFLVQHLTEFGEQKNLNKAYHILFDYLLVDQTGIDTEYLNDLKRELSLKYEELNTQEAKEKTKTLSNSIERLSTAEHESDNYKKPKFYIIEDLCKDVGSLYNEYSTEITSDRFNKLFIFFQKLINANQKMQENIDRKTSEQGRVNNGFNN